MKKSALFIVDVQQALFETIPAPYEADEVIDRINRLIEQARTKGVPIFFNQYQLPGFLDQGSEGWQLHPRLLQEPDDVFIHKTTADPFNSTDVNIQLKALGISDLIICGYASEFCVDTNVRRANGLGYTIQLVADSHTTVDKKHLEAKRIREHHNITLAMSPTISNPTHNQVEFFT